MRALKSDEGAALRRSELAGATGCRVRPEKAAGDELKPPLLTGVPIA